MGVLSDFFSLTGFNSNSSPIGRVLKEGLTYLDRAALHDLSSAVAEVEKQRLEGCLLETGCALGGSSVVIASAKKRERPFYVFDVFGLIPPPSEQDGTDVHERYQVITAGTAKGMGGGEYYGYQKDLYQKVQQTFSAFQLPVETNSIHLIQGLYEDTLRVDQPVALAHIDCDWYESVMTCLRRIEPHLVQGGVLVIDDYHAWSGCRKAVDEYFSDKKQDYEFVQKSRLHIVRRSKRA